MTFAPSEVGNLAFAGEKMMLISKKPSMMSNYLVYRRSHLVLCVILSLLLTILNVTSLAQTTLGIDRDEWNAHLSEEILAMAADSIQTSGISGNCSNYMYCGQIAGAVPLTNITVGLLSNGNAIPTNPAYELHLQSIASASALFVLNQTAISETNELLQQTAKTTVIGTCLSVCYDQLQGQAHTVPSVVCETSVTTVGRSLQLAVSLMCPKNMTDKVIDTDVAELRTSLRCLEQGRRSASVISSAPSLLFTLLALIFWSNYQRSRLLILTGYLITLAQPIIFSLLPWYDVCSFAEALASSRLSGLRYLIRMEISLQMYSTCVQVGISLFPASFYALKMMKTAFPVASLWTYSFKVLPFIIVVFNWPVCALLYHLTGSILLGTGLFIYTFYLLVYFVYSAAHESVSAQATQMHTA
jgi:hypothetical protein